MYDELVRLFASPDHQPVVVNAADWSTGRLPDLLDAPVALWGRGPLAAGAGWWRILRFSADRELALHRVRRFARTFDRETEVHRIRPGALAGGDLRAAVRGRLLAGAAVRIMSDGAEDSVLDRAIADAGVQPTDGTSTIRAGSDGSVVIPCRRSSGEVVLRAGRAGSPADLSSSTEALTAVSGAHPAIPRLLDSGEVGGARWSLETRLPGRRPARLSAALVRDVTELLAALPRSGRAISAPHEDLRAIASVLPALRDPLTRVDRSLAEQLRGVPSVARHGDCWRGNLLAVDGRLTGIVDWDAWHPADLPGTDLLQLLSTERRHRLGVSLGRVWAERPWDAPGFRRRAEALLGTPVPEAQPWNAVGIAWWAREVAGTLARLPRRRDDRTWIDENVRAVLSRIAA